MAVSVLHISESDIGGGAAAVAYKIHDGLRRRGHSSRMLVGRRLSQDPDVRNVKRGVAWRAADRASSSVLDRLGLQYVLYPSSFGVAADPWFRTANIVQLHNLHGSYFSFTALPLLGRRRPLVWLLEDEWAYTGHIAYALDCERWRTGCGSCPYLDEYPQLARDTTALLWRLKRLVYAKTELVLVVASRWSRERVDSSPLLRRFPVHVIPHGVDTRVFSPGSRKESRTILGLPLDVPIVLFVASDLNEARKGLKLLEEALRTLPERPLLVTLGLGSPAPDIPHCALGAIRDESLLAAAYRAADVFAVPTLADVQTQTAPESIACGTPCVSFDSGGVTEVVRDGETGLHAPFGDVSGLARALRRLLEDTDLRERLASRCREIALSEFSVDTQVDRYEALYESITTAP